MFFCFLFCPTPETPTHPSLEFSTIFFWTLPLLDHKQVWLAIDTVSCSSLLKRLNLVISTNFFDNSWLRMQNTDWRRGTRTWASGSRSWKRRLRLWRRRLRCWRSPDEILIMQLLRLKDHSEYLINAGKALWYYTGCSEMKVTQNLALNW